MYALEKHKAIAKAQGMKFVIPMKPSIQPREIDGAYKAFIYDEFAQRYLESIGVEPTKININALREKHKIHPDDLELIPKFKQNGCIRDELQVERSLAPRKMQQPPSITDADLWQKVVKAGTEMVPGGPIGRNWKDEEDGAAPALNTGEIVDKQDIRELFEPSKQVVQSALADFSSLYPLEKLNRPLTSAQRTEIEKLLQCELIVDLVQTLCYYLHDRIFRLGDVLKNPRILCQAGQEDPIPPLSPRAYDATIWRINEAYALLLAPYKRAKPLLSVVGVLIAFTARCVAMRLLTFEFPNWIRSVDGMEFTAGAESAIMNLLDPNGYMRQIDLFGDGKTATQPHNPVGSNAWRNQHKSTRKRKWMHQMYKLSPLMGTLSGSLMSRETKGIITGAEALTNPQRAKKRSDAMDNVSRTKRVGSMAAGVKASLPYSNVTS